MKKVLVIGGGGHAKSCIEALSYHPDYSVSGINDPNISVSPFLHIPLVEGSLKDLFPVHTIVLLGIGFIKNPKPREKLINEIQSIGFSTPSFVSSSAYLASNSNIDGGTIVMHQALINTHVEIGSFTIVNSKALIEHDVKVGSNCHISTGAIINGASKIGSNTFIGSNAVVGNNIEIGNNCIVQAGAFLNHDLQNGEIFKA
jgi:sugar O-acyltransferase (sialic acid O-acetyltransferase NeuD family)|tara:strand:- start:1103 stop:1705 length:603 start_codon:yes stop_codon:yes gene_type:complete